MSLKTVSVAPGGGGGSGTVTSVAVSGGTTGLTTSGGPVTTSGTITLAGTLAVANGGTGQTTVTTGDLLYGSAANTWSKLADVATGSVLISGGVGVAPSWSAAPTLTSITVPTVNSATSLTFQTNGTTTAMTVDTSGNVGIGTSSPGSKLEVKGAGSTITDAVLRINNPSTAAYSTAIFDFYSNGRTRALLYGQQDNTGLGGFLIFNTSNTGGTVTEAMRIDSSGNVGIGTSSPNASAILDAQSTTKGVRFPNMTTTQKNAVSSPAAGLVVFDTTLAKLCVYSGAAWQTITSV